MSARAVAAVMLILFGLASVHCRLEVLPGFDLLQFCCGKDAAPHQDDCGDDVCFAIEKGGCLSKDTRLDCPVPLLEFAALSVAEILPPEPAPRLVQIVDGLAPPETLRTWQFLSRTALPPRAPSLAS